jgi:hypothetical protein
MVGTQARVLISREASDFAFDVARIVQKILMQRAMEHAILRDDDGAVTVSIDDVRAALDQTLLNDVHREMEPGGNEYHDARRKSA